MDNITLIHGDCLEKMKDIPDKSIDMILCDLPYGTTACKWDIIIPFEPLWAQYKRIIKDCGAIALFGSEPFSSYLRMSNIKEFKYDWIWNKKINGAFATVKYRPGIITENISVFCKSTLNFYPIMGIADINKIRPPNKGSSGSDSAKVSSGIAKSKDTYNNKIRYPTNILTYSKYNAECNQLNRIHPTQKPVLLLEYLIKTYTLENETILDNCMGSGSTGVACINTDRKFIGIEKDDKYFEIAKKRIDDAIKDRAAMLF